MNISDQVFSVGSLTREIKQKLEGSFRELWLKGELSDVVHHRSGHLYLSLKDSSAQISGVMWRSRAQRLEFRPSNGTEVLVFGRIVVYEKGGRYQLDIEAMQPAGMGALAQEFEKLKARLQAEGLFDPDRKRPIPLQPKVVGVITSESGAAVRDIMVTLRRRGFDLNVILVPAKVQGDGAAEEVASAIKRLEALPGDKRPDTIIVSRGGGSLEDLWAFNEEVTVRAIAECSIPIISGVGHETDTTLADFVADLRAPTPTGAAERATSDRSEIVDRVSYLGQRLTRSIEQKIGTLSQQLDSAAGGYGLKRVPDQLAQYIQQVDELNGRAERSISRLLERKTSAITQSRGRLLALSPLNVLNRGYSVVKSGDWVVQDASEVMEGQLLEIRLAKGSLESRVEMVIPADSKKKH